MKNTINKIKMFGLLVLVAGSMIGCGVDDPKVQNEMNAWKQDTASAFDDSGLDTLAGEIDNALVGGITGIDYAAGTR